MSILLLIVLSLSTYVSFCHANPAMQVEPPSTKLLPRVKVDQPDIRSCTRNERRKIVRTLREATEWARLANDTAWDRTEGRPDNEQYQAWRQVRQGIFGRFYGSTRQRVRMEMGEIFDSLLWELERSPGGPRQDQDGGGNVVRMKLYPSKQKMVCVKFSC